MLVVQVPTAARKEVQLDGIQSPKVGGTINPYAFVGLTTSSRDSKNTPLAVVSAL